MTFEDTGTLPPTEVTIQVPLTFSAQDLSDILCTAVEGGIGYWSTITRGLRTPDLDYIEVDLYETEEEEGAIYEVTLNTIARGMQLIIKHHNCIECTPRCGLQADGTYEAIITGDVGMIDSSDADNILQAGLFDEIIYG